MERLILNKLLNWKSGFETVVNRDRKRGAKK